MKRIADTVNSLTGRTSARDSLIAVIIYSFIVLIVFYPVPFRLSSVIAGFPARDGWQYTWWLWFARRLLLEGRELADLYLMNHPVGLHHPFQWSLIYLSLVALPLGSVFSPAATFNLMVLGSFTLSGLAAYHLCRELTGNHWAAVLGGAIFAFAPNRLGHAMAGWLPQMTVYLYPWYALLLIRTLRCPTLRRAIGLGVLAGLSATVYVMHIAYFMMPLTLIIVGADVIQRKHTFFKRRRILCLGLAFFIASTIVLPFIMPLIQGGLRGEMDYLSTHGILHHSTDLMAFFTPSPFHPVLGPSDLIPSFAQSVFEDPEALRSGLAYSGIITSILALWAVLGKRPRLWRWAVLAIGAALLALGPILIVGGEPITYTTDGYKTHILLPYTILRQVPLLRWARTPGRLNAVGMLGLAVLAAYGMADWLARFSLNRWKAGWVSLVVMLLILFEFLPIWPFPVGDATIPSVIQQIAQECVDGTLLHLPLERRRVNHRALYFQTFMDNPIVGGEVLRMLPKTPPWWKTIEGLITPGSDPDVVPRPNEAERKPWLHHFGVDYVIFHDLEYDVLGSDADKFYHDSAQALLGSPRYTDDLLSAFPVPDEVSSLEEPYLYTPGGGWHSPQQDGDVWRRWMYDDGELYIYSTREESGALRFNVDSHLDFPLLEVYCNDHLLDTFVVDERTMYTTRPFTLTKGMNVFRFHAPGGCPDVLDDPRCWRGALMEPPADEAPLPCDAPTSCRTFVFDNLSFVPQREFGPGDGISVDFGEQMRLRGWELSTTTLQPGDMLTATLSWEAMAELNEHYVVFIHLISPDGQLVAQHDGAPVGERVPANAWPPGSSIRYPATLTLPDDLPDGNYRPMVGVYLWPDLKRLPVHTDVAGARNNVFELERVRITR
jgi:hypothetical protein